MKKVKTTMQPKREIEVTEDEFNNLRTLGVLSEVDGKPWKRDADSGKSGKSQPSQGTEKKEG
jgi:hypothetical protein